MLWNLYHDICDTIIQLYQDNVCMKRQYEQHILAEHTQSEIVLRIET